MSNGKDRGFQDAISGGQIFIPHQEPFDRTLVSQQDWHSRWSGLAATDSGRATLTAILDDAEIGIAPK
jgi:hypothetical protein